ncbi:hypothetical protein KIN20_024642 [Parelaphostrongylus tenuis]|uniref:Uncharacterized protein n=1 Tax=Parelaphostrongylus tenuis TaxID=148309 RepID=A0AAD5N7S9_PARTN|nr:hypothetical protein KIN20_024642 [Parelaphostrongylus tenuis]
MAASAIMAVRKISHNRDGILSKVAQRKRKEMEVRFFKQNVSCHSDARDLKILNM